MAEIDFYMHIYGTKDAINVEELSSADIVERKRGKWKYQTMVHESGIKANGVECSICGATYNLSITLPDMMVEALNFCPNCGADNREKSEDIPMEYFESGGK